MVHVPKHRKGKSKKFYHNFHGPFTIVEQTSDVNYRIAPVKGRNPTTDIVHVYRLKPYYAPNDWTPDDEN